MHDDFVCTQGYKGRGAKRVMWDKHDKLFRELPNQIHNSPGDSAGAAVAVNEKIDPILRAICMHHQMAIEQRKNVIGNLNLKVSPG
jgi:hypothetical protein